MGGFVGLCLWLVVWLVVFWVRLGLVCLLWWGWFVCIGELVVLVVVVDFWWVCCGGFVVVCEL